MDGFVFAFLVTPHKRCPEKNRQSISANVKAPTLWAEDRPSSWGYPPASMLPRIDCCMP